MPTGDQATGIGRTLDEAFKDAAGQLQGNHPEFLEAKLISITYLTGDDPAGRIPQGEEGFQIVAEVVS